MSPLLESRLSEGRNPLGSESIAEFIFILILIVLLALPILAGTVLTSYAWISGVFMKGANSVQSTRDLAQQLLVASQRIVTLEKKLADAQLEVTKYKQDAKDTDKLRSLLGLKRKIDRRTVAADVVGRNADNWFEQVIIDRGEKDSVRPGSAVVTSQGVVGQVMKVSPEASVVKLISDPDERIGVLIARINQPGILVGRHKDPPIIEHVPVGTSVEIGDKVTCLGNGGTFPPGHPVGVVTMVKRDTNGTTLSIDVKPSENFYDLTHVLIVPPIED